MYLHLSITHVPFQLCWARQMVLPCLLLVFLVKSIPGFLVPGLGPSFSPWQSWESGPLEGAVFVSVSSSLWKKGPCITTLLGSWPWP